MDDLKTAIWEVKPLSDIKELLHKCPRDDLEKLTIDGFDILQHAILADSLEVVHLLFMKGFFLRQCEEGQVPYLHLACLCGYPSISLTILQFRPTDFDLRIANIFDWEKLHVILVEGKYGNEPVFSDDKFEATAEELRSDKEGPLYSPVDIAATTGHYKCVKSLLTVSASECTSKSLLKRAVDVCSFSSLKLLMECDSPDQTEIDQAFCTALKQKQSDCMGICLDHGKVDVYNLLNGMSPYHVLYMYTSSYQIFGRDCRNKGLDTSTQVLIDHGIDVNDKHPIGSFPVYSLIAALVHEKDSYPNKIPTYHIKCLEMLLKAGADLNFDEILFSQEDGHGDSEQQAVGRDLFASGLNAFFISLQASDTWRPHLAEHLDVCCLMLLEHGADPTYLNPYGDTPLHDLVKVMAMQHAMGHMHADLGTMCRMLLYFGADPNQKSSNGLYPVHYYFPILVNLMGGKIAFNRWLQADNMQQVFQLLYYMDIDAAIDAYQLIVDCLVDAKQDGVPDRAIEMACSYAKALVFQPKSLLELSKLFIWKCVDRSHIKLKQLELPKQLVRGIKDVFMLDIDYR